MASLIKRQLGQILIDGGFLKKNVLDRACEEQLRTHELLGQVLVHMGVLKERDIIEPLLIQDRLSSIDDAVKIAAGERKLLGALLVGWVASFWISSVELCAGVGAIVGAVPYAYLYFLRQARFARCDATSAPLSRRSWPRRSI